MRLKRKICTYLGRLYVYVWGKFHKIERKVLFDSFGGKQYSDSPRAISEKLHELYPEYKIVWKLTNINKKYNIIPEYVNVISSSKEFYKELATSLCYVTTDCMEPNKYKRKNQFFIQTWHGDRGMKKVLYSIWEEAKNKKPKTKKRLIPITDNEVTDICVAASNYGEMVYKKAFKYNGRIIKIGMPRNDKLKKKSFEEYKKIKEMLNIPIDTKIIIYAPTFRDNIKFKQNILINLENIVEKLEQNKEKWICITRAHSATKQLSETNSDKIIDLTDYPDMADLLLISDILITDYSSCAGDFILMDKLTILAPFDIKEYERTCRELYFPLEDIGYIIARNQKELENIILNRNNINVKENCENIRKFYGINETGNSAEEICKLIKTFDEHDNINK